MLFGTSFCPPSTVTTPELSLFTSHIQEEAGRGDPMCVAFIVRDGLSGCPLIIAYNRDEMLDRPAAPPQWWPDGGVDGIYAGRDLKAGGTWFGVTRRGRFAFLTNFREKLGQPVKTSRGSLVSGFLAASADAGVGGPLDYCRSLEPQDFAGFNLVVGEAASGSLVHASNRGDAQPHTIEESVSGEIAAASSWALFPTSSSN